MANPGIVAQFLDYLKCFLFSGGQAIKDTQGDTYTAYGIDYSKCGASNLEYPLEPVINNTSYISWFSISYSDSGEGEDNYTGAITSYSFNKSINTDSTTGKTTIEYSCSVSFNTSNLGVNYGILQVCFLTQIAIFVSTPISNYQPQNYTIMLAEYKPSNAITQSPSNITFQIVLNG